MKSPGTTAASGVDIDAWFQQNALKLAAAATAEAVADAFGKATAEAGFDAMACGEIDLEDRRRSCFYLNTWPKAWFEYYAREKVHEFDPILARVQALSGPFTWSDITSRSRRELQLFRAIRDFGWADGLAIPIPRSKTLIGLISLTSPEIVPGGTWRDMAVLFFTLAYEKLRLLTDGQSLTSLAGLTRRERDCLHLVAQGATDAGIAEALGISSATAHEHVERAKRKLGCRNRAQLAAVAVALGFARP